MKKKIICGECDGSGQNYEWQNKDLDVVVSDCNSCHGTGKTQINVFDERKISKKKPMLLPSRG